MSDQPLRVVVVGAGRRFHDAVGPALSLIDDRVEVVGVVARSVTSATSGASLLGSQGFTRLDQVPWGDVDRVIVSVPAPVVVGVCRELSDLGVCSELLVDTPVVMMNDLSRISVFGDFSQVGVLEDYWRLPSLLAMRDLVRGDEIGPLKRIVLAHSAHRSHGTAIARLLFDGAPFAGATRRRHDNGVDITYRARGGVRCEVVEPVDHSIGTIMVAGDRGDIQIGGDRATLRPVIEDGWIQQWRFGERLLDAPNASQRCAMARLSARTDEPPSVLVQQKIVALSEQLTAAPGADAWYGLDLGLADRTAAWLGRTAPWVVDPLAWIGRSAMRDLALPTLRRIQR